MVREHGRHGHVAWLWLLGTGLLLIGMALGGSVPAAMAENDDGENNNTPLQDDDDDDADEVNGDNGDELVRDDDDDDDENGNGEEEENGVATDENGEAVPDDDDDTDENGNGNGNGEEAPDDTEPDTEPDDEEEVDVRLRIVTDPAAISFAELVGESVPGTSITRRRLGDAPRVRPFLNDEAEIVLTTTPLTRDETLRVVDRMHRAPIAYPLAIDVIAVYVREGNPVDRIDLEQLRGIYEGEITNWREIGGPDQSITPYLPRIGTDTYRYIVNELFPGIRLGGHVRQADSAADIAQTIRQSGNNQGAIGLGSLASHQNVVRILPVAEHERAQHYRPIPEDIASGNYPYRRVIFAYTLDRASGVAAEWIEAAQGPLQDRLQDRQYFPLNITD